MAYTNSPLAKVVMLSPNHSGQRKHKIDTITIHCVVGQASAERIGEIFLQKSRQASCNYGVGYDGSIVLCVEERNRSWCTGGKDKNGNPIRVNGISGADNDQRAITIEVASDKSHPYAVTDKALEALIELCADICRRNNIKKLLWEGDKSLVGEINRQNLTVHRWFANKACPGDYLYERHSLIAEEVNKRLEGEKDMFDNIPAEWSKEAVEWAVDNGILYGDENGDYKLRQPCTREQMCVFLHRLYKLQEESK